MEEIHDFLIKLQSYLHNPDSQLGSAIEEQYEGIVLSNVELQQLNLNEEPLNWYIEQLTDIWKQLRKKKNISPSQLEQTLQSLKDMQSHFEGLQNPQMTIAKLRQEVLFLQMKLDCGTRMQQKESQDNQYFQRAAEEINNLKQLNRQLRKEVQQLAEARKEDSRRHQDILRNQKLHSHQKPFNVKQLEEENEKLRQMNLDLLKEQQNLKEQMQQQVNQISDTKELARMRDLVDKLQQENQTLEEKIQDLYDKLELGKQNDLENQVATLEKKLASHTIQMQKSIEENKQLQQRIETLRQQNQKYNEKCLEPLGIRCLPEMKGVQSHFNTVMHLLEVMTPFTQILTVTDKVSQIILKFITYIRKESDALTVTSAVSLQELLPIEMQNDNRANDFLFQIIDHLSRALTKKESQKSDIATIIQAQDSPIYDLFFFLQRVFPINLEIQPNEVPLINSIKHIRYFEGNMKQGIEFQQYVQGLIKLEGQENMIGEEVADFNFLVFPSYLILNVCELCLQKADIKLGLKLPSSALNPEKTDLEYELLAIVHCNEGPNKQPIYSITLQKHNQWVQICQDQAQVVTINEILTFKSPYNDKELLIYKKSRI